MSEPRKRRPLTTEDVDTAAKNEEERKRVAKARAKAQDDRAVEDRERLLKAADFNDRLQGTAALDAAKLGKRKGRQFMQNFQRFRNGSTREPIRIGAPKGSTERGHRFIASPNPVTEKDYQYKYHVAGRNAKGKPVLRKVLASGQPTYTVTTSNYRDALNPRGPTSYLTKSRAVFSGPAKNQISRPGFTPLKDSKVSQMREALLDDSPLAGGANLLLKVRDAQRKDTSDYVYGTSGEAYRRKFSDAEYLQENIKLQKSGKLESEKILQRIYNRGKGKGTPSVVPDKSTGTPTINVPRERLENISLKPPSPTPVGMGYVGKPPGTNDALTKELNDLNIPDDATQAVVNGLDYIANSGPTKKVAPKYPSHYPPFPDTVSLVDAMAKKRGLYQTLPTVPDKMLLHPVLRILVDNPPPRDELTDTMADLGIKNKMSPPSPGRASDKIPGIGPSEMRGVAKELIDFTTRPRIHETPAGTESAMTGVPRDSDWFDQTTELDRLADERVVMPQPSTQEEPKVYNEEVRNLIDALDTKQAGKGGNTRDVFTSFIAKSDPVVRLPENLFMRKRGWLNDAFSQTYAALNAGKTRKVVTRGRR